MSQREHANPWTEIVKRLDLIIALLLDETDLSSKASMTDKIAKLRELGASPATVAKILQKPLNYVTASTSMRRKAKHRE